ncbi:uncharacterized protein LOC106640931 [Copidosoma floridanum]|uniref:uncharacterized protein LOC106640931 n=1 Tax=Copidosoma floridanum TaxID=29053 RepID=UPI0006C9B094|nr:uncharacterized protein LOC106640931 [Copidosoma floridanum]
MVKRTTDGDIRRYQERLIFRALQRHITYSEQQPPELISMDLSAGEMPEVMVEEEEKIAAPIKSTAKEVEAAPTAASYENEEKMQFSQCEWLDNIDLQSPLSP